MYRVGRSELLQEAGFVRIERSDHAGQQGNQDHQHDHHRADEAQGALAGEVQNAGVPGVTRWAGLPGPSPTERYDSPEPRITGSHRLPAPRSHQLSAISLQPAIA